jgi:hypothetical protein
MKKLIATLGLIGVLLASSTVAKNGLSVSDFQGDDNQQTCSDKRTNSKMVTDWGIFVTALTGIFVTALTGTIQTDGFTRNDNKVKTLANCGI